MKIAQLEAFVVVAEELHFRRAAERLYTQPSTVSTQISQLEAEYGTPLFIRNSRNVTLSPAGHTLLEKAKAALASINDLKRTARALASSERQELVVGTMDEGLAELSQVVNANYQVRYPAVILESIAVDYGDLGAANMKSDIDLEVTVSPESFFDPAQTVHVPLFAETLVAVLPRSHKLASEGSIRVEAVLDERFVSISGLRTALHETFMLTARRPDHQSTDITITAAHMHNLLNHVAQGSGIFTATHGVSRFFPRPDVVYVPITDLEPVTVYITHRRNERRPHVLAYVEECVNAVNSSLGLIPTASNATGGPS